MRAFVGPGERGWPRLRAEDAEFVERSRLIIMVWYRCIWKKMFFCFLYQSRLIAQERCKRWGAAAMA